MMIFGIFWEGLTWAWDFFSWGWVFTTCHPGGGLSKGRLIRGGPSHPPPSPGMGKGARPCVGGSGQTHPHVKFEHENIFHV